MITVQISDNNQEGKDSNILRHVGTLQGSHSANCLKVILKNQTQKAIYSNVFLEKNFSSMYRFRVPKFLPLVNLIKGSDVTLAAPRAQE